MDKKYSKLAKYYDLLLIRFFPVWKKWLKQVLPFIEGQKVLEISFGTGYLMTQYAARFNVYGIDYNDKMIEITRRKLRKKGLSATILKGNVENLPFEDNTFDTIINTMSFTGYPDGEKALAEMQRVLKKNGKLLLLDVDYPANKNILGTLIVKIGEVFGDVIRNLKACIDRTGMDYKEINAGGFGSVYLFVCTKK
ncbi:MAG: class I SAM-dependent methyltransferase [Bacteroidetes bacterium]|nr:class I SAM-dependent methyltransferase [Bacteroidota bacterium]